MFISVLLPKFFSPGDLDKIQAAVKEAESRTSGEIVPYVVEQSDPYEEAVWRCAGLITLLTLVSMFFVHRFTDFWFPVSVRELALATMLAGGLGAVAAHFIPLLKRFFAGKDTLHRRVTTRATEAFVSEEVFNTRDRTGILIFISSFEREVIVLGDSGINAKVEQHEWDRIVEMIITGINTKKSADGLIDAIRACGELLERKGIEKRADDKDELSDSLRLGGDKP